jgi:hypothetical protein
MKLILLSLVINLVSLQQLYYLGLQKIVLYLAHQLLNIIVLLLDFLVDLRQKHQHHVLVILLLLVVNTHSVDPFFKLVLVLLELLYLVLKILHLLLLSLVRLECLLLCVNQIHLSLLGFSYLVYYLIKLAFNQALLILESLYFVPFHIIFNGF